MKYNLVFDRYNTFRGSLCNKLDVNLFRQQRDMDYFTIEKIDDDLLPENFDTSEIQNTQAFNLSGYMVFPEEELYLFESFDQMIMEFQSTMGELIQKFKPFIKFDDSELQKVEILFEYLYKKIHEFNVLIHEEDEVIDHANFFKMDLLVKHIVDSFGGKK